MNRFKVLLSLCLVFTTALATVQVVDPVNETYEQGDEINLRQKPYQTGYNILLTIEKDKWINLTSPDFDTYIEDLNNTLKISLRKIPSEKGNYSSEITFIGEDNTTQTNTLLYRAKKTKLHAYMKYPLNRELPKNDTVSIGKVAPGQRMTLVLGRKLNSGPFKWGEAEVIGKESSYYNVPKDKELNEIIPVETIQKKNLHKENQTYIALNLEAPEETGSYEFEIKLKSLFSFPATRKLSVEVEKDVYSFEVSDLTATAGEPNEIPVSIESDSIAVEKFTFTPQSLPKDWVMGPKGKEATEIKVRAGEDKESSLPIQVDQEGMYEASYRVMDRGGRFVGTYSSEIYVKPTIKSKLGGFKKGHSLTLPILQPFYSLFSLLG